ncbi:MAG: hypothetical protein ACREBJ_00680 [Nitrosotalea sp.]
MPRFGMRLLAQNVVSGTHHHRHDRDATFLQILNRTAYRCVA